MTIPRYGKRYQNFSYHFPNKSDFFKNALSFRVFLDLLPNFSEILFCLISNEKRLVTVKVHVTIQEVILYLLRILRSINRLQKKSVKIKLMKEEQKHYGSLGFNLFL